MDWDPTYSRMSLGDHLEELRRCLIRSLIGVAVAMVATFYLGFTLIGWLARPLLEAQQAYGYTPQTITTDPTAGFTTVYLPVALIAAVVLASPWIIYQVWHFIASGLYAHEKRVVYVLTPFSCVMTALGVLFAYYILLPVCLMFFLHWSTYYPTYEPGPPGALIRSLSPAANPADNLQPAPLADAPLMLPTLAEAPPTLVEGMIWVDRQTGHIRAVRNGRIGVVQFHPDRLLSPMPDLGWFVRFAAFMMLSVVLAFQLPVIMLVVGWTGVVSPYWLAGFRRYAIFACLLLGAILTPTDLVSMFVLAAPLYGLYEFGLLLMRHVYREPPGDTHEAEEQLF